MECKLGGFKKALLQNPCEMIRGQLFAVTLTFGQRVRVTARKSQSYSPRRSEVQPENLNQTAPNRCLNRIVAVFCRKKGLKAFLNPAKVECKCLACQNPQDRVHMQWELQ